MLIIPAIDLQDGCVVRFVQGRINKKVYSKDPIKTAKHWVKCGAKILHIVDLDGAFTGTQKNLSIVEEIAGNVGVPVQFGGGIRKIEIIRQVLGFGVYRVVLGTKAVEDRQFLKKVLVEFKDKVLVSIDAKGLNVQTRGWKASGEDTDCFVFAKFLKEIGFKRLIYTDVLKDGTLSGPNLVAIKKMLKETGLNIIASGGVSNIEDLINLRKLENLGLEGVIIGKALYEGRFTLSEALKIGG